ncbi:hypothetical protein [Acaryochloris marina]|uniref:hypothetical protein n=1 Tax=Acaryochloris marina TaxID=155978 RepID=UPI001BAF04F6|nr:hypothetical protein [Acaryochloris marina]QUY41855.1 hypothetical protein I1H34_21910 [Acaryochloris marina S15]
MDGGRVQDAGETPIHIQNLFLSQGSLRYLHPWEESLQGIGLNPGFVPTKTLRLIHENSSILDER